MSQKNQVHPDLNSFCKEFFDVKRLKDATFNNILEMEKDDKIPLLCGILKLEHLNLTSPIINKFVKKILEEVKSFKDKEFKKKIMYKVNMFIMFQTKLALDKMEYTLIDDKNNKKRVDLDIFKMRKDSIISEKHHGTNLGFPKNPNYIDFTLVDVMEDDCCDICIQHQVMNDNKEKWAILNMASRKFPNGGWQEGHWAQEESITKRGNYIEHLYKKKDELYEIGEFEGIYSENVAIFRGNEKEGYPFWPSVSFINCIAVAAYDLNLGHNDAPPFAKDREKLLENTTKKIEVILKIAFMKKVECLVLGPLGCGAFKNDPELVSLAFLNALKKFAGHFKRVIFSIVGGNSRNFNAFRKTFGGELGLKSIRLYQCKERMNCPHLKPNWLDEKKRQIHLLSNYHFDNQCEWGGNCNRYADEVDHCERFIHPPKCEAEFCENRDKTSHKSEFWHSSECKFKDNCKDYENSDHRKKFYHKKKKCSDFGFCRNILIKEHTSIYSHPSSICSSYRNKKKCSETDFYHFKEQIHFTNYCCDQKSQNFADKFCDPSEVFIGFDLLQEFLSHARIFIHDFKPLCPQFEKCHPSIYGKCFYEYGIFSHLCLINHYKKCEHQKNPKHFEDFVHTNQWLSFLFFIKLRDIFIKDKQYNFENYCDKNDCKDFDEIHHLKFMHKKPCKSADFFKLELGNLVNMGFVLQKYEFGFKPLCKNIEQCSFLENHESDECKSKSHFCIEGRSCRLIKDQNHCKLFIHLEDKLVDDILKKIKPIDAKKSLENPNKSNKQEIQANGNAQIQLLRPGQSRTNQEFIYSSDYFKNDIKSKDNEKFETPNTNQVLPSSDEQPNDYPQDKTIMIFESILLNKGATGTFRKFIPPHSGTVYQELLHSSLIEEKLKFQDEEYDLLKMFDSIEPSIRKYFNEIQRQSLYIELKGEEKVEILGGFLNKKSFSRLDWLENYTFKEVSEYFKSDFIKIDDKIQDLEQEIKDSFKLLIKKTIAHEISSVYLDVKLENVTLNNLIEKLLREEKNEINAILQNLKSKHPEYQKINKTVNNTLLNWVKQNLNKEKQKIVNNLMIDMDNTLNIANLLKPELGENIVLELRNNIKDHPKTFWLRNLPSKFSKSKEKFSDIMHMRNRNFVYNFQMSNSLMVAKKISESSMGIEYIEPIEFQKEFIELQKTSCRNAFLLPNKISLADIKSISLEGKLFPSVKRLLEENSIEFSPSQKQMIDDEHIQIELKDAEDQGFNILIHALDENTVFPYELSEKFHIKFEMAGNGLRLFFLEKMEEEFKEKHTFNIGFKFTTQEFQVSGTRVYSIKFSDKKHPDLNPQELDQVKVYVEIDYDNIDLILNVKLQNNNKGFPVEIISQQFNCKISIKFLGLSAFMGNSVEIYNMVIKT